MRRNDGYIIEFITQGRFVKVTAVDPQTGIEASIVGDARENETVLTRHAVRKLEYVLSKQSGA